jgi:HlyD family secretion protein
MGDPVNRTLKVVLTGLVICGTAAGITAYLLSKRNGNDVPKAVEVKAGSITDKAQAVGDIEPKQRFSVKSKIPGIIKNCFVEVGDKVKAGDPLFEIGPDPTPSERTGVGRATDRAEAIYERAKARNDRYKGLFASGIVSKQDMEEAKESYELAKVALAEAQENQDIALKGRIDTGTAKVESVIRAPADGTLLTRAVNPGDPIVPLTSFQPGTELAAIADVRELLFRGTVDEIDVGRLDTGLPARIKIGAINSGEITGKLTRIAPQSRVKDGATIFDVEITLDPVAKIILRAGYSCNASIIIQEKKDVLLLPERVVSYEKGKEKASVEIPGPTPKVPTKKVDIQVGISDGLNVEVVSGLKKGDKVLEKAPKKEKE